ncbi:MAG: hypothetical protein ABIH34_05490 [Nanoarchaeota archaeon]
MAAENLDRLVSSVGEAKDLLVESIDDILQRNDILESDLETAQRYRILTNFSEKIRSSIRLAHSQKQYSKIEKDLLKIYRVVKLTEELHTEHKRKDGREYVVHALEVMMMTRMHTDDYVTLAAALLHDIIEEQVDYEMKKEGYEKNEIEELGPWEEFKTRRTELRREELSDLRGILLKGLGTGTRTKDGKVIRGATYSEMEDIYAIVTKMSRYRTKDQSYHAFIEEMIDERTHIPAFRKGTKSRHVTKQHILKSCQIKSADRAVDVYDTQGRNGRIPSDWDYLMMLRDACGGDPEYRSRLTVPLSFEVLKEGIEARRPSQVMNPKARLFKVWKNIYFINRVRQYLSTSRSAVESEEREILEKTQRSLIKDTLEETRKLQAYLGLYHFKELRIETAREVEKDVKRYDQEGFFDKRTAKSNEADLPRWRRFDGTVDFYTSWVHEDEEKPESFREKIAELSENRLLQYEHTLAFKRLLKKYERNEAFFNAGMHERKAT